MLSTGVYKSSCGDYVAGITLWIFLLLGPYVCWLYIKFIREESVNGGSEMYINGSQQLHPKLACSSNLH